MILELIQETLNQFPLLTNVWLQAGIVVGLSLIVAFIVWVVFAKYMKHIAKKTKTEADDLLFEKTKKPLFILIVVYGVQLALRIIEAGKIVEKIMDVAVAIIFLVLIARFVNFVITMWGETFAKKTKTKTDEVLLPFVHKVINVVFVIVGFLWILRIAEVDLTPYLAGVGISGLVLGLALQDILKNVFGGVTLLLDKTFQVGDKIQLEDGTTGMIYDIGLRSTKLKTFDNEIIYVPNGYLSNSRVQNYTRPDLKVRTHVLFGVEYGSNPAKVRKVVLQTLNNLEKIMDDPAPNVQFIQMGDFALQFKANFWIRNWEEAYDKKLEATEAIYAALNKAKIGIPFPTHTVHLRK